MGEREGRRERREGRREREGRESVDVLYIDVNRLQCDRDHSLAHCNDDRPVNERDYFPDK